MPAAIAVPLARRRAELLVFGKQFGLLSFGVAIAAPAPSTPFLYSALHAEGTQLQADSNGTHYRAA